MIYFAIGIGAGLLIFVCAYMLGRGTRFEKRRDLADMQESLDRCARSQEPPEASYGPFPADPDQTTWGEIAAGWEKLEMQQRGWHWPMS